MNYVFLFLKTNKIPEFELSIEHGVGCGSRFSEIQLAFVSLSSWFFSGVLGSPELDMTGSDVNWEISALSVCACIKLEFPDKRASSSCVLKLKLFW